SVQSSRRPDHARLSDPRGARGVCENGPVQEDTRPPRDVNQHARLGGRRDAGQEREVRGPPAAISTPGARTRSRTRGREPEPASRSKNGRSVAPRSRTNDRGRRVAAGGWQIGIATWECAARIRTDSLSARSPPSYLGRSTRRPCPPALPAFRPRVAAGTH